MIQLDWWNLVMFKRIREIKINYKQYGEGEDIVLLHGWGQNISMMDPIGNYLKVNHRITIVDLPGFGLSMEPPMVYGVSDYMEVVHDLLRELGIDNPILIGHSFGGRISIVYASKYVTKKVILFGSPCIRHEHKSKKQTLFKAIKKVKVFKPLVNVLKNHMGSVDYRKASPMMKDVLVKVVNEDLSSYAKKISCPCLLIWGDRDEAVPVEDAQKLDQMLENSALIVLPGTHYCYLENLHQVIDIINNFI